MQRRRGASLRWLALPVVTVGWLAVAPSTAGAEATAPNPNFDGYCDATTQTCSLMQPQGNSNTVWGELTYSISGDTITFVVTPNPESAGITEAQYCDSATPYEEITANLCSGSDRQFGDDGPASQAIDLTYDADDNTYTGAVTYDADEPYWTVHYVIAGETVYSVRNDLPTPPSCPAGTTGSDANGNGSMDEGECTTIQTPTCPAGTTGSDVNGNGRMDEGECTPIQTSGSDTCPDGSAMPTVDRNGDGAINATDCTIVTSNTDTTNTNTNANTKAITTAVLSAEVARSADVSPAVAPAAVVAASADIAPAAVAPAEVASAALAATGNQTPVAVEAGIGFLLVGLGAAMTRLSRRKAVAC